MKHAPATPLADASVRDQKELIRRSRAYPRLVEAIKAIEASYRAHQEMWPDDVPAPSARDAFALLRELGEL